MAAQEGTLDVSKDLQERTDPIPTDKILMVNDVTKEVQQIDLEKLGKIATVSFAPADEDDIFQ